MCRSYLAVPIAIVISSISVASALQNTTPDVAPLKSVDYFASKDTIVLSGGNPIVTDELRGSTTGRELTYHIADDRITVVGDDNVRTLTEHRVTKKSR